MTQFVTPQLLIAIMAALAAMGVACGAMFKAYIGLSETQRKEIASLNELNRIALATLHDQHGKAFASIHETHAKVIERMHDECAKEAAETTAARVAEMKAVTAAVITLGDMAARAERALNGQKRGS